MAVTRIEFGESAQPGEVTLITVEDRVASQDAATRAEDAATRAEAAEGTFTAPANDVVATMVTGAGPTQTALDGRYAPHLFSIMAGLPHYSYLNSYGSVTGVTAHYPELVAAAHGSTYSSRSFNGDQMQDTALAAVGTTSRKWTPSNGLVMVSNPINDVGWQQGDAQGLDGYKLSLEALIAVLRASSRIEHTAFTFAGAWNAAPYSASTLSGGSVRNQPTSPAPGATATVTFTGRASHFLTYGKVGADGGVFTVTLDGVAVGGNYSTSSRGRATHNSPSQTWFPMVVKLPTMSSGSHTLVITTVSGSNLVGTVLMAPTDPPLISIEKAPAPTDAAYVSFYGSTAVDTYRSVFNSAIDDVIALFPKDGMIVTSRPDVGWRSAFRQADGLHPNDLGMGRETAAVIVALGDVPLA